MTAPMIGIIVSTGSIVLLVLLYQFEARRGARFFSTSRELLDTVIDVCKKRIDSVLLYFRREALRGSLHYLFHTVLVWVLSCLRGLEKRVRQILVQNKETAHRIAHTERTSRNKLDEIREHKQSVALTDAEKKKHKDAALLGIYK